jgi:hypothetical protein
MLLQRPAKRGVSIALQGREMHMASYRSNALAPHLKGVSDANKVTHLPSYSILRPSPRETLKRHLIPETVECILKLQNCEAEPSWPVIIQCISGHIPRVEKCVASAVLTGGKQPSRAIQIGDSSVVSTITAASVAFVIKITPRSVC